MDSLAGAADARVADWPLMQSFVPTGVITCLYIVGVVVGPRLMQFRKPYNLRLFVLCHNTCLVFLNTYSFYLLLNGSWRAGYNLLCQPLYYSTNPAEMMVASGIWWYYALRAVDLVDTIILILRKKNAHLSFLHTYHHATMFPIWWVGARYVAGGNAFFGPLLNSFVHMVMYTYYAIAALGPKYRKYLWWKRYLTTMQMTQFLLVIGHSIQTIITKCEQPFFYLHYAQALYLVSLFVLFANFFYQEYFKSEKKANKDGKSKSN